MFRATHFDPATAPSTPDGATDWSRDFFARPAFLTVSGQLEAEIGALALSRVYCFGPTFRAENSNTSRHLAEFWMVEPEVAFLDLDGNAALAEEFLRAVLREVLERCGDDLRFFDEHIEHGVVAALEHVARRPLTDDLHRCVARLNAAAPSSSRSPGARIRRASTSGH
jgi:asparaginyl-tRNA synthetase